MPQVSKYPLREQVYNRIFELLLKVIRDSFSKKQAEELLNDLLTPTEKIMLAKRLSIAVLLLKDYSYESIQAILRVSRPTIADVNRSLKYGGKGYKKFAKRILKEEKMAKFWEKVEDLVLGAISQGGKGTGSWRYLHHEIKKKRRKKHTPI